MISRPGINVIRGSVLLLHTCGLPLLLTNAYAEMSQAEIKTITANWKCQWCPYAKDVQKEGKLEAGLGNVSNDSFKHGKYTGLDQQGMYLVGNGSYDYKDSQSRYLNLDVTDAGLDSRQVEIEGGKQGDYDLRLQYSMLPGLNIDTARTPYRGESNQSLPAGWVQGDTTGAMTQLASSLHNEDIYTERETIDLGVSLYSSPTLSYDLNFQQQTRQGNKPMGFGIGQNVINIRSAILAVPVDTITKQAEAKVYYRAKRWQGSLGYAFSLFDNANDHVFWENAYSTPATAPEGQAALEPKNEMQQINMDGLYRFSEDMRATIAVALGRMTQNADFLPYTVNGTIATSTLPRSSLDGEVNTFNTVLRFNSRWNEKWNYSAQYRHNEQANSTPRETYNYVVGDTANSIIPRTNIPFSFREREWSLQGKYQITQQRHIILDFSHETDERTYQEVDITNENTLSLFYRSKINEALQWSLRLKGSKREGDDYTAVSEINPPENSLLRKYNLADRNRRLAAASLSYFLTDDLQINVFGDYANDDYFNSDVGLQESKQSTVALELQYRLSDNLNMSVDYNATDIDSSQIGTTWNAKNVDSVYVTHVGVNYQLTGYKLSLGADVTYANSVGDITVSTGSGFPKLESTRKTLTLSANYRVSEQSDIHAYFGYEKYEEEDWAIDGVAPNTLGNVLTLGESSPSYDIGVFALSYRSRF